jgi:hypothetical protein
MSRPPDLPGVLILALAIALPGVGVPQGPTPGGPLPGPLPLFPADNWWNADISAAPLDPASAAFIQWVGVARGLHPDFGGDAEDEPEIYGLPYATVPGNQPLVPVDFYYPEESDPGAPGRPAGYPIPEEAKTQPRWLEGGYPGAADPGGDRHLLLVDRDQRLLFELYDLHWDGARWTGGSGAVWPLDSNRRRPEGWTSADAAGLAILPGLVRYDEAYSGDPIRHAFRVTVRATNGYVFPASHEAGGTSGALPMGARLRLKAARDLSGFAPPLRRIFQAMKTYGLIVADNGSDLYVSGTYDTRWDNDLLNPAFASLKGSDFEVVRLGWQPEGDPPPPPPDPEPCVESSTTLCLNRERFGVRVEWTDYSGHQGAGRAYPLTTDSGLFWFFDESNLEMLVKVIDGCDFNARYWIYAAATTDVAYTVTVVDSATGDTWARSNSLGHASPAFTDTSAFDCP